MTESEQKAFKFGRDFFDLVRFWRIDKKVGEAGFGNLVIEIAEFTKLSDADARTLALKVANSDHNAAALCEVKTPLTVEELAVLVNSKKFRAAILDREFRLSKN